MARNPLRRWWRTLNKDIPDPELFTVWARDPSKLWQAFKRILIAAAIIVVILYFVVLTAGVILCLLQ